MSHHLRKAKKSARISASIEVQPDGRQIFFLIKDQENSPGVYLIDYELDEK